MGVECPGFNLEEVGGQVGNLDMGGLRKPEVRNLGLLRICPVWLVLVEEMLALERRVPSACVGEGIVVFRVRGLTFYQVRIIGESVWRA